MYLEIRISKMLRNNWLILHVYCALLNFVSNFEYIFSDGYYYERKEIFIRYLDSFTLKSTNYKYIINCCQLKKINFMIEKLKDKFNV